jgi:hypothetical protein
MYRFIRTGTAKHAATLPAAVQCAAELTSYLNKQYSMNLKFGVVMFGTPSVQWHFETDSLDKLRQINEKMLQDREYLAIIQKFGDVWLEGSLKDTIVAFPG